jgi:hypothetical protein
MTATPWLDDTPYSWFFGTQDIWGHRRPELAHDTPQPANVRPDPIGAGLAYAFVWQLHSRITTQKLGFRSGDEATALTSVYDLFKFARDQVQSAGPKCHQTADVIWWLLNRDVRPFTARWHRTKEKGLLAVEDVARRFRAELERLRQALLAWAWLLRELATEAPIGSGPRRLPEPPQAPGLEMATTPCPRDGMAAPTPFAVDFARIVEAERKLIRDWRLQTGREQDVLCGIALSGGGIRSATFSLGVLRQLALHIDILGVDYLSTVSGGGYLGTLITMAYENGIVCSNPTRGPLGRDQDQDLGADVIAWLRGRGDVMKPDLSFIASLAGGVIGVGGGAANEYRKRLGEGWILERQQRDGNFDPILVGRTSQQPIAISNLKAAAPVQLWNMALNATNADERLRVALRGRSCDFYTVSRAGAESRLLGYAPDQSMEIDAAMALSAAACAPTTSEDTGSWLLRIAGAAGADLGRWVDHSTGSTRAASWWERVKSLIGSSAAHRGSAFVSDGGHIENLGLYQLLRRRCGCILAIDGEEDPKMTFAGLMKLQHLVRVEQGILMDIDVTGLHPGTDDKNELRSDSHFTVIPITYPELPARDGQDPQPACRGVLVYVKLSLTGDEPQYLRAYRADHPEFPHHSTVYQQAFDDRMFEAYLALGEHVGQQLVSETWCGGAPAVGFSAWIQQLARRFGEV